MILPSLGFILLFCAYLSSEKSHVNAFFLAAGTGTTACISSCPTTTTTGIRTRVQLQSKDYPYYGHRRKWTAKRITSSSLGTTTMASDNQDPIQSIAALDKLVPRSKINELVQSKSNLQGSLQILWHFSLLGLAATITSLSPTLSLLAMAFVSSFYFHALHECVHRTTFRSKSMNRLFAHVFGLLCVRPARHYFYYHWQHHKYTGNTTLDSELQQGSFLDLPVDNIFSYLAYLSGIPFWVDALSSLVKHAWGTCSEIYLPTPTAKKEIQNEARVYLALYAAMAACHLVGCSRNLLVRYWVLPALLGQPFLRFYLLAEHRGRNNTAFIYENTRTMQTNGFYRKLAWYMPYHMEHHAWPSIPFFKLHEAHQLLLEAAATTSGTTSTPRPLLRQGEQIDPSGGTKGYIHFHVQFLKTLFSRPAAQ